MDKIRPILLELLLAIFLIIAILFPPYKYSYTKEGYTSTSEYGSFHQEGQYYEFKQYEYIFSNPQTAFWNEEHHEKRYFKRNLLYSELAVECLLGLVIYGLFLFIKYKLAGQKSEQALNKP